MRGLAVAGRMGSGKNWLIDVLLKAIPNTTSIEISKIIREFATAQGLIQEPFERKKHVPIMQQLGADDRFGWASRAEERCKLARLERMVPILSACRRPPDEQAARRLGMPVIVVTAPREVRLQRIIDRDHLSVTEAKAIIDNPETEACIDEIEADHTFKNDGRHTMYELSRLFNYLASVR